MTSLTSLWCLQISQLFLLLKNVSKKTFLRKTETIADFHVSFTSQKLWIWFSFSGNSFTFLQTLAALDQLARDLHPHPSHHLNVIMFLSVLLSSNTVYCNLTTPDMICPNTFLFFTTVTIDFSFTISSSIQHETLLQDLTVTSWIHSIDEWNLQYSFSPLHLDNLYVCYNRIFVDVFVLESLCRGVSASDRFVIRRFMLPIIHVISTKLLCAWSWKCIPVYSQYPFFYISNQKFKQLPRKSLIC